MDWSLPQRCWSGPPETVLRDPCASDFNLTFPGVRQNTFWSRGERAPRKLRTLSACSLRPSPPQACRPACPKPIGDRSGRFFSSAHERERRPRSALFASRMGLRDGGICFASRWHPLPNLLRNRSCRRHTDPSPARLRRACSPWRAQKPDSGAHHFHIALRFPRPALLMRHAKSQTS